MRSVVMLSAFFALAFVPCLSADESELGTYMHGGWIIQGKAQGEQVEGTMMVLPAAEGQTQFYRWTMKYPDEVRHGSGIGGIDPSTGKVVEHGFSGDSHWTNTYDEVLGDSVGRTTGTRVGTVSGEPFEGRISVERTSKDRFVYKVESDDEVVVDFVFERRGKDTDGEKAFKAYAELAVGGTWVSIIDGEEFHDTYEWIDDGQFFQLTSKAAGEFSGGVTIFGVDPDTGKFATWGFGADGMVSHGTTRQIKDGVWVGQWSGSSPEGTVSSRARVTKVDNDMVRYEVLEQSIDGNIPEFPKVTIWKRKR